MLRTVQIPKRKSGFFAFWSYYQKREFTQSSISLKKYKYALDPKKQRNKSSTQGFKDNFTRRVVSEGRALTFFSLGDEGHTNPGKDSYSHKQIAYGEIVREAVEILLSSKEIDEEVKRCCIEITQVEVSPTLASANIFWKLEENSDQVYTKAETEEVLSKYLPQLRLLIPAYTTITQTPSIHFTFDQSGEKQKEIEALFESISREEKQFLERQSQQQQQQQQQAAPNIK